VPYPGASEVNGDKALRVVYTEGWNTAGWPDVTSVDVDDGVGEQVAADLRVDV